MNFDLAPVGAAVLPCFGVGKHSAFLRHDDAGYTIPGDAVQTWRKDIGLFKQRIGGGEIAAECIEKQRGEEADHRNGMLRGFVTCCVKKGEFVGVRVW